MNEHVLIVDDEEMIRDLLCSALSQETYVCHQAANVDEAFLLLNKQPVDLVISDIMMPGRSGVELLRDLKNIDQNIAVLMITGLSDMNTAMECVHLGADDYITKPFNMKVLIARIHAVLRRRESAAVSAGEVLKIHDIMINPGRHEVVCGRSSIELTNSEFRLVHFLAQRPGWVFTREQIVDGVKGEDYAVTDRAVDVQMVSLRRKLGKRGDYIETVRGVGYRFKE